MTLAERNMNEVARFRAALETIDRNIPHSGCYGCGTCIAHRALHGHWPTRGRRCCWPAQARKMDDEIRDRTRSASGY